MTDDLLIRYRSLLTDIDAWFGRVAGRFRSKVNCRRGCFDCCLGLFDITALDARLLEEGFAQLPPDVQADIRDRAREVMAKAAAVDPRLAGRRDLAGLTEEEVDRVVDAVGDVPCPVLGKDGECRLYAHRPMVCRLNGVPLVDVRGKVVQREGCFKNFLEVGDAPASVMGLDTVKIKREEWKLLKELGEGEEGRFIAQVFEAKGS